MGYASDGRGTFDALGPTMPSTYGDYEVIAPLATGGMGGVFLASHLTSGERVALKVLDPHFANHGEVVRRLRAERVISIIARGFCWLRSQSSGSMSRNTASPPAAHDQR